MGFIIFRATGAAMSTSQDVMEGIILETGDDQIAVSQAALELGIAWDKGSDMLFESSTNFGKGIIPYLSSEYGKSFEISLFPHSKFTRVCHRTPVTNETVAAHCATGKKAVGVKMRWIRQLDLWSPDCAFLDFRSSRFQPSVDYRRQFTLVVGITRVEALAL